MKKLIFCFAIILSTGFLSFAQTTATDSIHFSMSGANIIDSVPRPLGWVSDFEKIYPKQEITTMDSLIDAFQKKKRYEIAIVTVDGSLTSDSAFDIYILNIANAWGVGKKGSDNGIVIGISSEFARIRIVNGAGIASKLSDDDTKIIIDSVIIPDFKEGNYFKGTKDGLMAIMEKLK